MNGIKYCALGAAMGLAACEAAPVNDTVESDSPQQVEGAVQQLRAGQGDSGSFLGMDILVTNPDGSAVPCDPDSLRVKVTARVSATGESFTLERDQVSVACSNKEPDLALVADNSGSESRSLGLLQQATNTLVKPVVGASGRVSLTRVSTNAKILSELTAEADVLHKAVATMHVSNGWTALYDGIRLANATLVAGHAGESETKFSDARSFCSSTRKLGIAVITDGGDNNSAGERLKTPADDGIATTLKDVLDLSVAGISTPIHTIGVGKHLDAKSLSAMSRATGGTHVVLDSYDDLSDMLLALADYSNDAYEVCSTLPKTVCGAVDLDISYVTSLSDGTRVKGTRTQAIEIPCDEGGPSDVELPGGETGCDYGSVASAASAKNLDLFGKAVYFDDGADLPAGEYVVSYEGGCMKYNAGQDWAVHAADERGIPSKWWLVTLSDKGTPAKLVMPPGSVGYRVGEGGFGTFAECVETNRKKLPTLTIKHAGGPLGVWLEDSPYEDNVSGEGGQNPRWNVTRIGECTGPKDVTLPGGTPGCDFGTAVSGATSKSLDLFGEPVYFNDGESLPAGDYLVRYEDGCMKYSGNQDWAVHADSAKGNPWKWWLVAPPALGERTPVKVAFPPATIGYRVGSGGHASFAECVAANLEVAPTMFHHEGGPLGVWLEDNPYSDNVTGVDGRNPKWNIARVGSCD